MALHRNRRGPVARVPGIGSRARTAALVALLLLFLSGCAAPGLDHDQEVASQRTCASLRERVANRALAPFGIVAEDLPDPDGKVDPLSPRVLVSDPEQFYATLEQRLAASGIGPSHEPSPISPATRLIQACRHLAG